MAKNESLKEVQTTTAPDKQGEKKLTMKERAAEFGAKHPNIAKAGKVAGKALTGVAVFGLGCLVGGKLSENDTPESGEESVEEIDF